MTRTPHTQQPLRQGRSSFEKEGSAVGGKSPKGYINVPFFSSCHFLSCFVASFDLVVASVTTLNSLHQTPSQLTLGGHHSSRNVCLVRSSETEINHSVNDGTWEIWLGPGRAAYEPEIWHTHHPHHGQSLRSGPTAWQRHHQRASPPTPGSRSRAGRRAGPTQLTTAPARRPQTAFAEASQSPA